MRKRMTEERIPLIQLKKRQRSAAPRTAEVRHSQNDASAAVRSQSASELQKVGVTVCVQWYGQRVAYVLQ